MQLSYKDNHIGSFTFYDNSYTNQKVYDKARKAIAEFYGSTHSQTKDFEETRRVLKNPNFYLEYRGNRIPKDSSNFVEYVKKLCPAGQFD